MVVSAILVNVSAILVKAPKLEPRSTISASFTSSRKSPQSYALWLLAFRTGPKSRLLRTSACAPLSRNLQGPSPLLVLDHSNLTLAPNSWQLQATCTIHRPTTFRPAASDIRENRSNDLNAELIAALTIRDLLAAKALSACEDRLARGGFIGRSAPPGPRRKPPLCRQSSSQG